MATLVPHPIERLATRMFRELEREGSIFGLPRSRFFLGDPDRDLSVHVHGHRVSSALGPAAGPHSQMAQNIVLAWLAGCRLIELKTVQVKDRLVIPRPCIDMATVGFNVEWSQELRLQESLEEYVKASMLIELLRASGVLPLQPGFEEVRHDLSVGYDLAGIESEAVAAFIEGMKDATATVARLRSQLPADLRSHDFPTRLSTSVTLSTFHGCPPDEITRIVEHLLRRHDLDCVVKLNPTLLGPQEGRHLLHDVLGFTGLVIPEQAWRDDTKWEQMVDFVGHLGETAGSMGRGFGVKFSNTQIVENDGTFLPASEALRYLSGPPLHVMAMALVHRFRGVFGDRYPISFSAGVDRRNFADLLSLGLAPITVCSDLLQPQGYGRVPAYYQHLAERMEAVGATDVTSWTLRAHGQADAALARVPVPAAQAEACRQALAGGADLAQAAGSHLPAWLTHARLLNTERYMEQVLADPRYRAPTHVRPPHKVESTLALLDCLTCDKCLPVCPNDANFTFALPQGPLLALTAWWDGTGWQGEQAPARMVERPHQIGNFVDFCNDCGNCDVFCPELGGPYHLKARFHSSLERFQAEADRDALFVQGDDTWARVGGQTLCVRSGAEGLHLLAEGVDLHFDPHDPLATLRGSATGPVDLGLAVLLDAVRVAVLESGRCTYLAVN